ncbi:MAG: hypothetical protein K2X99_01845, partial [Gemmatimonadaceae bacterium]|nr:hypothetical protein [Gemmatimonadaceae bacterium]
ASAASSHAPGAPAVMTPPLALPVAAPAPTLPGPNCRQCWFDFSDLNNIIGNCSEPQDVGMMNCMVSGTTCTNWDPCNETFDQQAHALALDGRAIVVRGPEAGAMRREARLVNANGTIACTLVNAPSRAPNDAAPVRIVM